jgi:hypothetical protein
MADSTYTTGGAPKARSDVYTGMLIVSLAALLVGCLLLWLDYRQYPSGSPPQIQASPPSQMGGDQGRPKEQPNPNKGQKKKDK